MVTLRTIATLLVLGTLLLPPHWCCAFDRSSGDDASRGIRSCCAGHVVPAMNVGRAAKAEPCCCAATESQPGGDDVDGRSRIGDGLPVDSPLCPYCLPRVAPNVEASAYGFDLPMLPAVGFQLPTLRETAVVATIDYGAFVPISGDLLARHCRWNC